jgi:uncharacterized membrane-anchored protein YitT (DUF2179 family)
MKEKEPKILTQTKDIAKIVFERNFKDFLFIIAGVGMASIGLKGFLLPNHFLDGGAMGISLLTEILTGLDLSLLIIIINLPFMVLGAKNISYFFALKSTLAIFVLAIFVHYVHLPVITSDKLLISIFGGFFLGTGIGFTIRGGAVIDGTEVLAISVSRKSSLTVGDVIALLNIILFSIAGILVNLETAMYSMLTYISASKTVDFVINGIEEYIGVMIVSRDSEGIRNQITNKLGRGVTILKSEAGFGTKGQMGNDGNVLFCVVTRLEVTKLLLEIEKIDRECFVVQYPIKDTKGGMIKKRPMH